MTLDWWGLGLQAINVLILVMLLGRVFWRPVAGAITQRQHAAQAMLDDAATTQTEAETALAQIAKTRKGIAAERDTILAQAKATADTITKAAQKEAQTKIDALHAEARVAIERAKTTAKSENAARAVTLSTQIAARLLAPFDTPAVQAAFLAQLVNALSDMPAAERAALVAAKGDIMLVTASEPQDAQKTSILRAVKDALGDAARLRLVTDPALIAGLELRSAHFVLHNSWQADLAAIRKEVADAC